MRVVLGIVTLQLLQHIQLEKREVGKRGRQKEYRDKDRDHLPSFQVMPQMPSEHLCVAQGQQLYVRHLWTVAQVTVSRKGSPTPSLQPHLTTT